MNKVWDSAQTQSAHCTSITLTERLWAQVNKYFSTEYMDELLLEDRGMLIRKALYLTILHLHKSVFCPQVLQGAMPGEIYIS